MRKTIVIIGLVVFFQAFSFGQIEKEISSSITKVTVYTQGAQIEREAAVSLQQGQMVLKLVGLSPYIKKESIRITGDGSYSLLNVQHQNDYINELDKNKEIESLKDKIEGLQFKIEDEGTWLKIIKDKLDFLNVNKEITGKEQALNPETFKTLNTIYGSNIESLNLELLKKQRLINDYQKETVKLNNQLNSLNSKSDLPSGTIIITIDAKQTINSKIYLNYLVDNASWYPSYDIRFLGIDKPLTVTYKANINQNTGIDWKDVHLVLSTAKTNISAQIPEFATFYLQFYYPEISQALQGKAAGVQIIDDSGSPGADSEIRIRGLSSINGNSEPIYVVDGVPQSNISSINPNDIDKIEVLKDASSTAIYGSSGSNGVVLVTTKQNKEKSSIPLTITSKRETSNEYIVEAPQTIQSNDKSVSVSFKETDLNAKFEYQSIPSLSENVFLIGKIVDWYKAEFIDGEANVYLENSFVGKSLINAKQFKDTLEISFGTDNNLSIKRERLTEFTANQLIGSNRKETIGFKLTIRNNKKYPITTKIIDQIPISTTKDIQVETIDLSGGKMDADSGKVIWEITLNSNESKELIIKYSVKYPKDKKVIIE
jgi:TonB-dependent SusC/RagA subfamily outer membrane receptor